jgi:Family of unknown function (DUF5343)
MATLPYVTAPGNVEKALLAIKTAATPPTVSQDFVKSILQIGGGSGNQMTAYLRKIGFVNPDGAPSALYKAFRNTNTAGKAAASALKVGYASLYARNEYMHTLKDEQLRGLIIEETGSAEDSATVGCILSCIKGIKKFATFDTAALEVLEADHHKDAKHASPPKDTTQNGNTGKSEGVGLKLSYTINLNLPATSDIAVFNAIFKSLKENLLRGPDD